MQSIFTSNMFVEADGSVTLSLNEIDLAENGKTVHDAKLALAKDILEYAENYQSEFELWNSAPNRRGHEVYVSFARSIGDPKVICDYITISDVVYGATRT